MFSRRNLLAAAPGGLVVTGIAGLSLAQSSDDASALRGENLRLALRRTDHTLFPSSPLGLIGAVLSGVVAFVLGRNPLAVLEGPPGQTVVGGVDEAAARYVTSRQQVFGSLPAVQNASLGDQRADFHKLTPFVGGIDDAHRELREPLDKILDTLNRFDANKSSTEVSAGEAQALRSLVPIVININTEHSSLCGYTDKHRDVSPVYGSIGSSVGISRDERFLRYYEEHKERARRQASDLLETSDKLAKSISILQKYVPVNNAAAG